jgi:hypothetical protein
MYRKDPTPGQTTDRERKAPGGKGSPMVKGNTGNSGTRRDYQKFYDPKRTAVNKRDVKSSSAIGKDGEATAVEIKGAPDQASPSSVPYYEVYSDYRKAAEKAMTREDVPPAYRKRVRDYYDSLKEE